MPLERMLMPARSDSCRHRATPVRATPCSALPSLIGLDACVFHFVGQFLVILRTEILGVGIVDRMLPDAAILGRLQFTGPGPLARFWNRRRRIRQRLVQPPRLVGHFGLVGIERLSWLRHGHLPFWRT